MEELVRGCAPEANTIGKSKSIFLSAACSAGLNIESLCTTRMLQRACEGYLDQRFHGEEPSRMLRPTHSLLVLSLEGNILRGVLDNSVSEPASLTPGVVLCHTGRT